MRHRRAERCLLRAEIALEADCDEDAREAIDEAARLNSEDPRLAALRARLDERAVATAVALQVAQQDTHRHRFVTFGAAALIFLAVGTGAFMVTRLNSSEVMSAPPGHVLPAPHAILPPAADPDASEGSVVVATAGRGPAPVAPQPVGDAAVRTTQQVPATPPVRASVVHRQLPAFNPQFAEPQQVTLPSAPQVSDPPSVLATSAPSTPEPPQAVVEAPLAAPASSASLVRLSEALPAANVPAAERPAPPEDPAVIEEPRVRAVLSRYEAAYSGLNAAAAQAVWPGVDERSLARAFDTLQSQRVALGRCAVQVEGTTANASCLGTITWTPKVGGGSQSADRQWRFELSNGNGAWRITRAEVR